MQFDAEVPVIESGEKVSIAGIAHRQRDVVSNKCGVADRPF
jgi:hypothetical protein